MEANKRLAWAQQQADKRVAAEYLVEQIRGNTEDKVSGLYSNVMTKLVVGYTYC